MFLKLAWRNIWRNKRRTLITIASVFFAVILATFMRSMNVGTYARMIENVVGFYTGYIQIQEIDYHDSKSIDNSFFLDDELIGTLENTKGIIGYTPRLETYCLANSGDQSKGVMIIGTDPEKEDHITQLKDKLVDGEYFQSDDQAVLMGAGLAEKLKLNINDTVVLLGQGYHGVTAAGKYPIKGILKFGNPELNKRMIYMPLKEAQYMVNGDVLTTIALKIDNNDKLFSIVDALNSKLGENIVAKSWEEIIPELKEGIEADEAGGVITIGILYLIITFGIFGTLLMMLAERKREFGVMISIGMKRSRLALIIVTESIILGMMGALTGIILSIPVIVYFYINPLRFTGELAKGYENYGFEPIMMVAIEPKIFLTQALLVFLIMAALSTYPFVKILNLKAIDALRS